MFLAALLVGTVGSAFAGGTSCGDNLYYEIVGTTLVLTSPNPSQPATIATAAFQNTTITSVTLPGNVWQIGSQAFMGCTALAEVDLGNVQDISTKAFQGCTSLTEVVIPVTVTNIGEHAFYGCSSLAQVICRPYTAPTLVTDAFTGCADGLQICVPALGTYNRKETNWSNYSDQIILCYLDENDEENMTAGKISTFRSTKTDIDIFRTLRKAGCFNTLTLPFNVPNIEESPLKGAEVYSFVRATVVGNVLQLDITQVTGNSLNAGTPYLIQWDNTGEVLNRLHFSGITWDADQKADDAGTGDVTYHGFYGKTHINDSTENGVNIDGNEHFNLFLGANNQLYWPTDGGTESAKMLGFRAWFRINGAQVAGAPVRRGMPAALHVVSAPTGLENTQSSTVGCQKILRDGQLVIIRNGVEYTVNGQMVL